jgi:hypothetical protein
METGSLWSQVTGECIAGEIEGKTLALFPSALSTYGEFKKRYPEGKILTRSNKTSEQTPYDWYARDETALGMFGRTDSFTRLKGKDIVFGIRAEGVQVAISKDYLSKSRFAVLEQFNQPVVVVSDSTCNSVTAFSLPNALTDVSGLKLINSKLTTANREMEWDAVTGKMTSGEEDDLVPLPITSAFWFAWASFFPKTELIK